VRFLRQFARFWYDFIVGDDWRLAVGAVTIVVAVTLAARDDINAWWLLPVGVGVLLAVSVGLVSPPSRRAARKHHR
jgi:hypothetical protein